MAPAGITILESATQMVADFTFEKDNPVEIERSLMVAHLAIDKDISEKVENSTMVAHLTFEKEIHDKMEESIMDTPTDITTRIGFAIDIDGVLLENTKGRRTCALPGAISALQKLENLKVPFVLLTNRLYGDPEEEISSLRLSLSLPELGPDQLIDRQTPFKLLVPQHKDKPVLAIGYQEYDNRHAVEKLGFKDVYTLEDFYEVYSDLAPKAISTYSNPGSKAGIIRKGFSCEGIRVEISAIFVFGSGGTMDIPDEELADWLPNKLLLQFLKSDSGDLGDPEKPNGNKLITNDSYLQSSAPKISYDTCFEDYEGFRESLEAFWESETGLDPDVLRQEEVGGKPSGPMYGYASMVLNRRQRELHGESADRLQKIIMIGDSPWYDIRGVNYYKVMSDEEDVWEGALVESGSWKYEEHGYPEGWDAPDVVVRGVEEAVMWGLESGWQNSEESEDSSSGAEDDASND